MHKVLFVCLGNACRSQMAEGFARTIGEGVLEVESAGLAPATLIPHLTREVMHQKGIELSEQYPKALSWMEAHSFDLVINLSGFEMPPEFQAKAREWIIQDPIGGKEKVYRKVRDQIEGLVTALVEELRQEESDSAGADERT